jgi:hypothetical protein
LYAFVIRADYRGVDFTSHDKKDPKANAIALAKDSGTVFHPRGLTKMISIDPKIICNTSIMLRMHLDSGSRMTVVHCP